MTDKTTHDKFTLSSYWPWQTQYTVNSFRYTSGTVAGELVVRTGDLETVVSLGHDRQGVFALIETLKRLADGMTDDKHSSVRWYIRNEVEIDIPANEVGDSSD